MNEFINNIIYIFEKLDIKHIIINVVVSIGLMSLFLTVFYFYYVLIIEQSMVENNIDIMITSLINTVKPFFTKYTSKYIENNLKDPDLEKADAEVIESNNKIKNDAIKTMGIICVVSIIIGFLLCVYYKINFLYVLRDNLLLLVLLAFTEYTFLHLVADKIITGDPNFIKYKLLVNMKEKIIFTE